MGVFGRPGGVLGASCGRPGGVLGASWGRLGVVLGVLGRLGSVCGGGPLKIRFSFRNSPLLGGVLGRLGASWGASWGRLGRVLGPSWGRLGSLGASWERLGAVLRRLGDVWGVPGSFSGLAFVMVFDYCGVCVCMCCGVLLVCVH